MISSFAIIIGLCLLLAPTFALRSSKHNWSFKSAGPPFSSGTTITPKVGINPITLLIPYKYKSFFGAGGDHSMTYDVVTVDTPKGQMPLFIQKDAGFPLQGERKIDLTIQYGYSSEMYFLVQQDATRRSHGIYQWRFINGLGKSSSALTLGATIVDKLQAIGNGQIGTNFDLKALFGDPMKNF